MPRPPTTMCYTCKRPYPTAQKTCPFCSTQVPDGSHHMPTATVEPEPNPDGTTDNQLENQES